MDRNELLNAMQARVVLSVQTYKEQLLSAGRFRRDISSAIDFALKKS